jgi:tetratricopeptide (TPR) repeat protein
MNPAPDARLSTSRRDGVTAAALAAVAFVAFAPALRCGFVNFDDPNYSFANAHVRGGLSLAGLRWAFTTFDNSNWHPLTWLTLQLDSTLWNPTGGGAGATGFHLTNVLLHAANAALLFVALRMLTGAFWRSATAALLFAVHPLRVESVAWIAERKDVLSVFFGLLALAAYVRYARRPSLPGYLAVVAAFALSLMCKPMLVTLPCLLLVLDWWPLGRARTGGDRLRLTVEKLPLLGLAVACAAMTLAVQSHQGAIGDLAKYPAAVRIANAAVGCVMYLSKTIWPASLAVFYPHTAAALPAWQAAGAAILLALLTAGAVALRRQAPYLLAAWLWFVGTLVPVLGLVQAGAQAYADRYSYFPQIGLLVALCWGVADLVAGRAREALAAAGIAALALTAVTWHQLHFWHDSVTLWEHTLQAAGDSTMALENLGEAFERQYRTADAKLCYEKALALDPKCVAARISLGATYLNQGEPRKAEAFLREACDLDANSALAQHYLGRALARQQNADEAVTHLERAATLTPDPSTIHCELGGIEVNRNNFAHAADWFRKALDLQPTNPDALAGLGICLFRQGRRQEGIARMGEAVRCNPRSGQRRFDLGTMWEAAGDEVRAVGEFREAVRLAPELAPAWSSLGVALARQRHDADAGKCLSRAATLDPSLLPDVLARLEAAGRPDLARQIKERAGGPGAPAGTR